MSFIVSNGQQWATPAAANRLLLQKTTHMTYDLRKQFPLKFMVSIVRFKY